MEKACQDVSMLSELIEKPSNLERWHLLPSRDNTTNELTRKALAVEEFLSTKEDQAYEKDIILDEVYFSKLLFIQPHAIYFDKIMEMSFMITSKKIKLFFFFI
jgi:hypothetical protein